MSSEGFEVDLDALIGAAKGIAALARDFEHTDVEDLLPAKAATGSTDLAAALGEFGDRWNRGIDHLAKDTAEIGARLGDCAMAYVEADRAAAESFRSLNARLDGLAHR